MQPQDDECYIFTDEALERLLANGSEQSHAIFEANDSKKRHRVTSNVRSDFLAAFADDEAMLSGGFATVARKDIDNRLAASFHDKLQNVQGINEPGVPDKIFLIAVARRVGASLVVGNDLDSGPSFSKLCEMLEVPYIGAAEFLTKYE